MSRRVRLRRQRQFGPVRPGQSPSAPAAQRPGALGPPSAEQRPSFSEQLWSLPDRRTVMFLSLGAGVVFIILLSIIFPKESYGAQILTDHSRFSHFPYPFTVQNLEHLNLLRRPWRTFRSMASRGARARILRDAPSAGRPGDGASARLTWRRLG